MTTTAATMEDRVREFAGGVPDPELPAVTLGMLGMIHDVEVEGSTARIELLPTFSGCPAQDYMAADVQTAVLSSVDGIEAVEVRWRRTPRWTADRISDEGRERLREFGIAPPGGRRALPVVGSKPPPAEARPCPYCGSTDTVRDAPFGPTPCRDIRFCESCNQPFEAFKPL